MSAKKIPRRQAIPILYTRGTHYEVGFDMGRNFESIIKSFLELCDQLNNVYLPLYETLEGKKVYYETLESVQQSFPQYIRELEGVADGAKVEFHKLFLLHMDDITQISADQDNLAPSEPTGCTTVIVNSPECQILAHTEDASSASLNHFYFVVAHIINDTPQGKYNVKEERFMSLCYAGHLPGYTMNFNHHGLVFSINTLLAADLRSGKTPRHFITRSLLSASNYEDAIKILTDSGVGAADGCSINLTFLGDKSPRTFYNVEMGPVESHSNQSQLDIKEISNNEHDFHCNSYLRLPIKSVGGKSGDSSRSRMQTLCSYGQPKTKEDIIKLLGDQTNPPHTVFRENGDLDDAAKTIAVGIFDCIEGTVSIYSDNPINNEPLAVLPLKL